MHAQTFCNDRNYQGWYFGPPFIHKRAYLSIGVARRKVPGRPDVGFKASRAHPHGGYTRSCIRTSENPPSTHSAE